MSPLLQVLLALYLLLTAYSYRRSEPWFAALGIILAIVHLRVAWTARRDRRREPGGR